MGLKMHRAKSRRFTQSWACALFGSCGIMELNSLVYTWKLVSVELVQCLVFWG